MLFMPAHPFVSIRKLSPSVGGIQHPFAVTVTSWARAGQPALRVVDPGEPILCRSAPQYPTPDGRVRVTRFGRSVLLGTPEPDEAPYYYWIWLSPNGVDHAVNRRTGWCCTCGRFDHGIRS